MYCKYLKKYYRGNIRVNIIQDLEIFALNDAYMAIYIEEINRIRIVPEY